MIWVILLLVAAFVFTGLIRYVRKHTAHVLVWRFLSGHSLDGQHRTNAGWFTRADKIMTPTGKAGRWHHMPRIHRAGIRQAATVAIAGIGWGLVTEPAVTLICVLIAVTIGLAAGIALSIRAGRAWHTRQAVISPLASALGPLLGIPDVAAQRAITLSSGYATVTSGPIGSVTLPSAFRADPAQRTSVEHLICSRLPVDIDFSWRTATSNQQLIIRAAPKPPEFVKFADFTDVMEDLEPGQALFGLDRKREPYFGSFSSDDPHWGAAVSSGRGKSTWLCIVAAQRLHSDIRARFTGIDPKMGSFTPLAGIPGVRLANNPRDIANMVDAITEVHTEMMTRLEILDTDPTAEFPEWLLAMDELATFSVMLKSWWNSPGVRSPSDPATPLLWSEVIGPLHWMGRAANVHVISVSQVLYDKTCGGIGLRSSMGLRGLSGFRAREWDMLVGTKPVPKSQKPKGRWVYSVNDGSEPVWVQNLFGSSQEIRDWAIFGRTNIPALSVG